MHCPNKALMYQYVGNPNRTSGGTGGQIMLTNTNSPYDTYNLKLGRYILGCCGVAEMSGMYAQLEKENHEHAKQDYLTVILRNFGLGKTFHFIITEHQIRNYCTGNSVFEFLVELGAKEIATQRNMLHGGMQLNVYAWCPLTNQKLVEKYVTHYTHREFDAEAKTLDPLWWTELKLEEQVELLAKYPDPTAEEIYAKQAQEREVALQNQLRDLKSTLSRTSLYKPELFQELGWRQLTEAQIALLDRESNKVVTKAQAPLDKALGTIKQSSHAIQQALKGSKAQSW